MKTKLAEALRRFGSFLQEHTIFQYLFMAACTSLIIEMLNHRSFLDGLFYPLRAPVAFGMNMAIILLILSISILFKILTAALSPLSFDAHPPKNRTFLAKVLLFLFFPLVLHVFTFR